MEVTMEFGNIASVRGMACNALQRQSEVVRDATESE